MSFYPLRPYLKTYHGQKADLRARIDDFNTRAFRIAKYVNLLLANDEAEIQMLTFAEISSDLGYDIQDVRSAISDGGYNGRTFGVRGPDRAALAGYRREGVARRDLQREALRR